MYRSGKVAFLFFILFPAVGFAQIDSLFNKFTFLQTEYDTNYVKKGLSDWAVHLYLQNRNNSFSSQDQTRHQSVYFDPLTNMTLGAGGSYKNFSLDFGFPIQNNKGDTAHATGLDFSTSLFVGQHVSDMGFRRFRGYYVSGYDSVQNELRSVFRSDIATANLYLNYLYNFNYRRFSFNASFIGREMQIKSAGAPLAGFFFSYMDLHANEPVVPPEFDIYYGSSIRISEANLWTLGLMGGYAYTFVLPARFYLTLSLVPGLAFTTGEVKSDVYYEIGEPVEVSFKLISKNAFGYSGKRFYGYLSSTTDRYWLRLSKEDQFKNNLSRWRFLVGYLINKADKR